MKIQRSFLTFSPNVLILLCFISPLTIACSCSEFDIEFMHERADLVFVGKAISKSRFRSFTQNRFTFEVSEIFKGKNTGKNVEVWSEKFQSSCGATFKVEKEYIVFTYKENGIEQKTNTCFSWNLKDNSPYYMIPFNRFYKTNLNASSHP